MSRSAGLANSRVWLDWLSLMVSGQEGPSESRGNSGCTGVLWVVQTLEVTRALVVLTSPVLTSLEPTSWALLLFDRQGDHMACE